METIPYDKNECQEIVLDLDTRTRKWTSHLVAGNLLYLTPFEEGDFDPYQIYYHPDEIDDENKLELYPGAGAIRVEPERIRVPIKSLPGIYDTRFKDRQSDAVSLIEEIQDDTGATLFYLDRTTLTFDLEPGDIDDTRFNFWKFSLKQKLTPPRSPLNGIPESTIEQRLRWADDNPQDKQAQAEATFIRGCQGDPQPEILPPAPGQGKPELRIVPHTKTEKTHHVEAELPDKEKTFNPFWFPFHYLNDYPFNQLSATDFAVFLIHYTKAWQSKKTAYNYYSTITDKFMSTLLHELRLIWKKTPPRKFRGKITQMPTSIRTIHSSHKKLFDLSIAIPTKLAKKGEHGTTRLIAMNPDQAKRRVGFRNKQREWIDKIPAKRQATRQRNRQNLHPTETA